MLARAPKRSVVVPVTMLALALGLSALTGCGDRSRRPAPSGPRGTRLDSSRLETKHAADVPTARPVVTVEVPKSDPKSIAWLAEAMQKPPTAASETDVPHVTSLALDATARGEARGLSKLGPTEHARLEEGGYTTRDVTLRPGDCLTGIAHGSLGVMEVDAFLLLAAASVPAVLVQDTRGGPIAVLGGAAGCYAFTGADETPCKLVVLSRKGAGEVVFALYKTGGGPAPPAVSPPATATVTPSAEPTKPPAK